MIPSGGVAAGEAPLAAILRELEEEIGLTDYASVELAETRDRSFGRSTHRSYVFLIRGAVCRPRWSIEIEDVATFAPNELPEPIRTTLIAILTA
jgi:8-oxo-dGTP pyrophosphatase MutT (NUDIX family)